MSVRGRRLAWLLLGWVVLLVLVELGARVLVESARFTWRPLPPFGRGALQREWLERSERELASGAEPVGYSRFDPVLGWTTAPLFASADGRVHVNSQGLRGTREYAPLPPEGARRWIACGESFTFCEEVRDEEAWPARLEAREPGLEVLNYGVGGYGTDQALLRASREARGPAEVLLVGLMLENIGRNVNRYRPLWYTGSQPAAKPRYRVTPGGLELVPLPFATRAEFVGAVRSHAVFTLLAEHEYWTSGIPLVLEHFATARLVAGKFAYAERKAERLWRDPGGEPFRTTLELLKAFRGVAQNLGGARLVVLIFPTRADLLYRLRNAKPYWDELHRALRELEIEFLDLSEALAAATREEAGIPGLYLESHFSPRGNALVADAIAQLLAP
jgi:hypothetical protein